MIKVIEMITVQDFEAALHHEMSQGFALVQCFVTPAQEYDQQNERYNYYTLYTAVLIKQTQVAVPIDATKHFGM